MTKHLFLSYMHEDAAVVQRLALELREYGINVWLDRTHIEPGQRWRDEIRRAIRDGDLFVACFSPAFATRDRSHMNEELTLAIEELRLRPADRAWFIPVVLDDGEVPDRSISASESLRDLQWVDLSVDWRRSVERIAKAANPPSRVTKELGNRSAKIPVPPTMSELPQAVGIDRHPILKLKNFARSAGFPQHGWAKTFASLDPEVRMMTVDQIIDRFFATTTRDHLVMYLESVKHMYRVSPHDTVLQTQFEDVCRAFGVDYGDLL